jgi:hypothetical protein
VSNIIMLQLTREEAAFGCYRTIHTPTGPTMIQIPPVQDGMVIRVPLAGGGEVYARIQVLGAQPVPPNKNRAGVVVGVSAAAIVALAVIIGVTVGLRGSSHADPGYTPAPVATDTTDSATTPSTDDPNDTPTAADTYQPPVTDPTTADDTPTMHPYETGTCLNGTLPDSTSAQAVSNVNVVDCGASDAHYKVIQSFFGTDDLHRCDGNSESQYSFSDVETWGGATLSSVVYCVVGLGSYAR